MAAGIGDIGGLKKFTGSGGFEALASGAGAAIEKFGQAQQYGAVAKAAGSNAAIIRANTEIDAKEAEFQALQAEGTSLATIGQSGLQSSGFADVLAMNVRRAHENVSNIRKVGVMEAAQKDMEAAEARKAAKKSKGAGIGSILGTVAGIVIGGPAGAAVGGALGGAIGGAI
jgi:hypothetical protein